MNLDVCNIEFAVYISDILMETFEGNLLYRYGLQKQQNHPFNHYPKSLTSTAVVLKIANQSTSSNLRVIRGDLKVWRPRPKLPIANGTFLHCSYYLKNVPGFHISIYHVLILI